MVVRMRRGEVLELLGSSSDVLVAMFFLWRRKTLEV